MTEKTQDVCWSCQGLIGATDNFCPHCGAAAGSAVQDTAEVNSLLKSDRGWAAEKSNDNCTGWGVACWSFVDFVHHKE
jgi:predicted amidophosphoribosyltransferase